MRLFVAKKPQLIVAIFLMLATLLVYGQVKNFEFLNFDDNKYVSENPHIKPGLTPKGLQWAFVADLTYDSMYADYWQPITMISRMIDIQLFGLNPGAHHLSNVFYHILNTLLLFLLLSRMTQKTWPSAFVAAVFALHPIQVEAVAWITARKDLLSTFFGLLTISSYLHYLKTPSIRRKFFDGRPLCLFSHVQTLSGHSSFDSPPLRHLAA